MNMEGPVDHQSDFPAVFGADEMALELVLHGQKQDPQLDKQQTSPPANTGDSRRYSSSVTAASSN